MSDVVVKFKDGTERRFEDRGAPGGSYCNSVAYVEGFVVITNPFGRKVSLPTADISEVIHESERRGW